MELKDLREALGVEDLRRDLQELRAAVAQLQPSMRPAWVNLRAACELKGCAYNSVKSRPELQPNRGKADATIGGRRVWMWATVQGWLAETDPPEGGKPAAAPGRRRAAGGAA